MATKPITRQQEREILKMAHPEYHGKDYKANGFDIYSYQLWLKDEVTGHNDYSAYRMMYITFIDEPKETFQMPKYYESHDIKRIVHWLKKQLGAEAFDLGS